MNNSYYQTPVYKNTTGLPNQQAMPFYDTTGNPNAMYNSGLAVDEQSYIENILRVNKGKKVSVYQSFADANNWKDRIFTGIIEQSGRDHIILSDPTTGKWYLLLMIYVNFVEFDEPINTIGQFYPSKR